MPTLVKKKSLLSERYLSKIELNVISTLRWMAVSALSAEKFDFPWSSLVHILLLLYTLPRSYYSSYFIENTFASIYIT